MLNLQGRLRAVDLDRVHELTRLRFKDANKFVTPEAVILYENSLFSEEEIVKLCEEAYKEFTGTQVKLETPTNSYIPRDVVNLFAGTNAVPIRFNVAQNEVLVGILYEDINEPILIPKHNVKRVVVPIFYYVNLRTRYYGVPRFLLPIPISEKVENIVQEAVSLGASDITISSIASGASVYYNVRKKKIHSRRQLAKEDVKEFVAFISNKAGATMDLSLNNNDPRYFSVDLDMHNRGRVVVNTTYYGYSTTIRVLSNEIFHMTLEDLNIKCLTREFIRNIVLSREKGLRLFIGETSSGKNTTILASIRELVITDNYKIVSVEQPVEILVDGVEQINAETDEEFEKNADSLLRCNPDILYFTEITARTAPSVIRASNTGKVVFTTLHANSIADCISRLMDITSMSSDRIISTIQSCVYQELIRDEEKDMIFPINVCVHFTEELKCELYGKSLVEIREILKEKEVLFKHDEEEKSRDSI